MFIVFCGTLFSVWRNCMVFVLHSSSWSSFSISYQLQSLYLFTLFVIFYWFSLSPSSITLLPCWFLCWLPASQAILKCLGELALFWCFSSGTRVNPREIDFLFEIAGLKQQTEIVHLCTSFFFIAARLLISLITELWRPNLGWLGSPTVSLTGPWTSCQIGPRGLNSTATVCLNGVRYQRVSPKGQNWGPCLFLLIDQRPLNPQCVLWDVEARGRYHPVRKSTEGATK